MPHAKPSPSNERSDTLRFPPLARPGSLSGEEVEGVEALYTAATMPPPGSGPEGATGPADPDGAAQPSTGTVIEDRYVLETPLAQGGNGVVWRARDRHLDQPVAVKLVAPRWADEDGVSQRLLEEATLLMRVDSPHVVHIIGAGLLASGAPYLVTELCEGVTLHDVLESHAVVDVREAVGWMRQAADGLADVHEAGIVHNDLKPTNLFLVESEPMKATLKLLDFGVAGARLGSITDGKAGAEVAGSPWYMAPERIAGSEAADHRADLWSLGVVLYELVTGRRPFDGDTVEDVCGRVMAGDPAPLSSLRPAASPAISDVVSRCLQLRREDRPQSARELSEELGRIHASLPEPKIPAGRPVLGSGPSALPLAAIEPPPPAGRAEDESLVQGGPEQLRAAMFGTRPAAPSTADVESSHAPLPRVPLDEPRQSLSPEPADPNAILWDEPTLPGFRPRRWPAVVAWSSVGVLGLLIAVAALMPTSRLSGVSGESPAAERGDASGVETAAGPSENQHDMALQGVRPEPLPSDQALAGSPDVPADGREELAMNRPITGGQQGADPSRAIGAPNRGPGPPLARNAPAVNQGVQQGPGPGSAPPASSASAPSNLARDLRALQPPSLRPRPPQDGETRPGRLDGDMGGTPHYPQPTEFGIPVDQVFINDRGQLVDAHGRPIGRPRRAPPTS